jgi:hypothetical protein
VSSALLAVTTHVPIDVDVSDSDVGDAPDNEHPDADPPVGVTDNTPEPEPPVVITKTDVPNTAVSSLIITRGACDARLTAKVRVIDAAAE